MLNAGPVVDIYRDPQQKAAYELPYRGFGPPGRLAHVFQANEFNANVWVDEKEVPYTFEHKNPYNWVRVRLIGGRSLFWSRQSFRFSDYEFKAKSHDGFGEDWPIGQAELGPYYSRVEEIFRVQVRWMGRRRCRMGTLCWMTVRGRSRCSGSRRPPRSAGSGVQATSGAGP